MTSNILFELYDKYSSKLISKEQYIDLAYKNHHLLFNYADYIKLTDIQSILITDKEIKMVSRKSKIIMLCKPNDKRIVPFEILNFKDYEGMYFDFFIKLTKESKVIFDIGSNIGWHSLNAAKLNKRSKIYSFEPIKDTYNYLVKNIKLNCLNNITPNNIGLSDKNSSVYFYVNPVLSASASEKKITKNNTNRIKVTLKKLDDYCTQKKITKIDLIKCDVEGAELFVLKGGQKILERFKPVLLIEMLRKWSKKYNYHPNDIINFMQSLDYLCYVLTSSNRLKQVSVVTDLTKDTNFIFLHQINHVKYIKQYVK